MRKNWATAFDKASLLYSSPFNAETYFGSHKSSYFLLHITLDYLLHKHARLVLRLETWAVGQPNILVSFIIM